MKTISFSLFTAVCLLLSGCRQEQLQAYRFEGAVFGTTYQVVYFDASDRGPGIEKDIDSIFAAVNASVNTYLPESDISRINSGEDSIRVDAIFQEIFLLSKKVHQESNGFFDPTVGSLRNAYGFGTEAPLPNLSRGILDSLMAQVGFEKVSLSSTGYIEKKTPQIYLDFNAIAKGYAVDLLAKYLISRRIQDLMVEIGGEITVRGRNISSGDLWEIGLEQFSSGIADRRVWETISLNNQSIAGSGNYRNFRFDSLTGQKLVHTINPTTGQAVPNDMLSAYVVAENCALADAYATAFMAMGISRARELLRKLDSIEACFVYVDPTNKVATYATEGFAKMMEK